MFNQAQRLFTRLPLATVIENNAGYKYFVTHGGVSSRIDLDYISSPSFNRFRFDSTNINISYDKETLKMAEQLSDLLWSDPAISLGCIPNKYRGVGFNFGPDVSESFCKRYGFNTIIRSHEVRQEGMGRDHTYCFTVFSNSKYCGGNNLAAVLLIDANKIGFKTHQFSALPLEMDDFDADKTSLIESFKMFLQQEADELINYFEENDENNSGSICVNLWAKILSDHIENKNGIVTDPKHFITLKDYLCPCNDTFKTASYKSMFDDAKGKKSSQLIEFVDTLFNLIDMNKNGFISQNEASVTIDLMNKNLGSSYDTSFFKNMDSNQDGKIDIFEFKSAFTKAYNL